MFDYILVNPRVLEKHVVLIIKNTFLHFRGVLHKRSYILLSKHDSEYMYVFAGAGDIQTIVWAGNCKTFYSYTDFDWF